MLAPSKCLQRHAYNASTHHCGQIKAFKVLLIRAISCGRVQVAKLQYTAHKAHKREVQTRASPNNNEKPSRRALEDELRDPQTALEYFLPRPLRIGFFAITSVSCLIAAGLGALNMLQGFMADPLVQQGSSSSAPTDLLINLIGCIVFAALAFADKQAGEQRIEQRKELRAKQVKSGDREVYLNEEGERMSRLKEVDDAWILRRLERWGRKEAMPFLGDKKGSILQSLVADQKPKLAVEVGTMAGYSTILIGQKLPPGGKLLTYEKDLFWFLAAKRFLWQASQGSNVKSQPELRLDRKVDVKLADAIEALQQWGARMPPLPSLALSTSDSRGDTKSSGSMSSIQSSGGSNSSSSNREDEGHTASSGRSSDGGQRIDLLFLDGIPKDTLSYLKAAEPLLAPGCLVIADNAGVFAQGGMKPYLEYVRNNPMYKTEYIESTLEWRDDVIDGMEVSVFLGNLSG